LTRVFLSVKSAIKTLLVVKYTPAPIPHRLNGNINSIKFLANMNEAIAVVRVIQAIKTDSFLPYLSEIIPAGIRIKLEETLDMKSNVPISVWLICK
jgi:hypothetical protein